MGLTAAGRGLLGLLLAGVLALAATSARLRVPAPGSETTNWLAAHSLAFDRDELPGEADSARFRQAFGAAPQGVRVEPHGGRYDAPRLATRAWSLALTAAGERGPLLLNACALLLAAAAAAWALRHALGEAAAWWIAVFLFGSVAFVAAFRWQSEILVFAAVVLACSMVWGRVGRVGNVSRSAEAPEQIYGGSIEGPSAALWPWPVASLILGLAVVRHPAYALLAVPILLDLPPLPSRARRAVFLGLSLLLLLLPLTLVAAWSGAPWESPAVTLHAGLAGWNLLYFAIGRNAGLLVGYLPLVALALASPAAGGRRALPWVVLGASLLQLAISPFDWAGELPEVGNPWFLPLYGALLFCAGPELRLRGALLAAVAAAPFLLPYWIAPLGDGARSPAGLEAFTSGIRERLPFETSLRTLPGSVERIGTGVRLRSTGPAIGLAGERLALLSASAPLLVESGAPLSSVRLDFSANAPAALAIEGGTAGNTTFRPNGEIAFELELGEPSRRHPLWWSRTPVAIYPLRVVVPSPGKMAPQSGSAAPGPGAEPVTFDLGLARVAGQENARP